MKPESKIILSRITKLKDRAAILNPSFSLFEITIDFRGKVILMAPVIRMDVQNLNCEKPEHMIQIENR